MLAMEKDRAPIKHAGNLRKTQGVKKNRPHTDPHTVTKARRGGADDITSCPHISNKKM